jgi:mercuric ion transport protein
MDASRQGTAEILSTAGNVMTSARDESGRQRLVALGGILGALAASSCCVVPLVLFSLGVGGAWVGNLTALAPYKPLFVAATTGVLGYGFYLVYWKPRRARANGAACATLVPSRLVRTALWIATVLVAAAFAFDYVAPLLLPF